MTLSLRAGGLAVLVALTFALSACGGGDADTPEDSQAPLAAEVDRAEAQGHSSEATGVSVKAVLPVNVRVVSWPVLEYEYRLALKNRGPAVEGVSVELLPPGHGVQIVDGRVEAGTLAANSVTLPADTIKVRKHWAVPFVFLPLRWNIMSGPAVIAGTAAVGAALANGDVQVTDSTGAGVCAEATVVTSSTGAFRCTVLQGRTAPFLIVVSDPFKAYPPLVSVVPVAPVAGATLVANATPITTAIVGQLAPNGDALAVVADRSLIDLAMLEAITTNVLTQISAVLAALGAPADYDPFTTQIVAGTITQGGNTADQVIEALRFSTVNGVRVVATVDNPGAALPLADAAASNPPVLPSPSLTLLSLTDSLRQIAGAMTDCFALPVAARALASDATIPPTLGGAEVTSMAAACSAIAHPTYLQNGYRLGQRYHGLLNDANMVGATVSPPEILRFVDDTSAADSDTAVVNFRVVDANGTAIALTEVVRKLPGSATPGHASDWWVYGNQQQVDSTVRAFVRRNEQFAPAPNPPFANASVSRFESGIELFVNKDGPGSTGLRAARLSGPGLPTAGLVYTRPNPGIVTDQTWLNIRRKDGLTDPGAATYADDVGNIFRLQRTQGLTGAAPLPVQPNPNQNNGNSTAFVNWAHPLDYGAPIGTPTASYIDFASLKANTAYTLELFYDGETAPRHVYSKTMLTPVVPASYAVNLRWLSLTPATLGHLDPAGALAGALPTMTLAWLPDPFVETIASAGVYTFGAGQSINDAVVPVARGASTATAAAPAGFQFPPLTGDGTSSRAIQLRYRMLDGSYKDSLSRFN
jgi:hypothetical protein